MNITQTKGRTVQTLFHNYTIKNNSYISSVGIFQVIVIMRNPKDTLVSYYHFYNTRTMFDKLPTFTDFFEIFRNNELVFGDWFDHVLGKC